MSKHETNNTSSVQPSGKARQSEGIQPMPETQDETKAVEDGRSHLSDGRVFVLEVQQDAVANQHQQTLRLRVEVERPCKIQFKSNSVRLALLRVRKFVSQAAQEPRASQGASQLRHSTSWHSTLGSCTGQTLPYRACAGRAR
jgi:hypothetical protein